MVTLDWRSPMTFSASATILSVSSWHVGMSLMRPMETPALRVCQLHTLMGQSGGGRNGYPICLHPQSPCHTCNSRPDSVVGVTVLVDDLAAGTSDEVLEVVELGALGAALEADDLGRDLVLEDTRSVLQGAAMSATSHSSVAPTGKCGQCRARKQQQSAP